MSTANAGTHSAESRTRILNEANRLFIEQGYHRLSMRQIAENAGISKAGIYHHFKDKEALFLAVLTDCLEKLELVILEAEQTDGPVKDKISVMVHRILNLPPRQRAIIRLASQEMGHITQSSRLSFNKIYHQKFIGRMAGLLARGAEAGEFQSIEPMTMTWALLGLIYPYLYPSHADYIGTSAETINQLLDIFFNGVAAH